MQVCQIICTARAQIIVQRNERKNYKRKHAERIHLRILRLIFFSYDRKANINVNFYVILHLIIRAKRTE